LWNDEYGNPTTPRKRSNNSLIGVIVVQHLATRMPLETATIKVTCLAGSKSDLVSYQT